MVVIFVMEGVCASQQEVDNEICTNNYVSHSYSSINVFLLQIIYN